MTLILTIFISDVHIDDNFSLKNYHLNLMHLILLRLSGVFHIRKANARKSVALPPVSFLIPSSPSSFSSQRLTDETDVADPGQMAYQAGNLWLRPKLVGSRRRLYRADNSMK